MPEEPAIDLIERSGNIRVVVIGAGIAGLVAAEACAKVGMQVIVLEASDRHGGAIRQVEIDGVRVDVGPDSYATRSEQLRTVVSELGLSPVSPDDDTVWITSPDGAAALPTANLAGIPENPWDPRVRQLIGWRGAWRAYLDRIRPPLTIGQQRSFGQLVRSRMGAIVYQRMVAPLALGGYGVSADDIDVEVVAPGLGAALTRAGSLAAAVMVLQQRADASGSAPAEIASFDGGLGVLVGALTHRIQSFGGQLRCSSAVRRLVYDEKSWQIELHPEQETASPKDGEPIRADIVIVATGEDEARRLLPELGAAAESAQPSPLEVVTLLVHAPALTNNPRGGRAYPVAGSSRARSVVHATARWAWLRERLGTDRHLLRVTFPAEALAGCTEREAISVALAEASSILGTRLTRDDLCGAHRESFTPAAPGSLIGHPATTAAVRDQVAKHHGLAVVGAWLSGSGLAQAATDADEQAKRVRHEALWGRGAEDKERNI